MLLETPDLKLANKSAPVNSKQTVYICFSYELYSFLICQRSGINSAKTFDRCLCHHGNHLLRHQEWDCHRFTLNGWQTLGDLKLILHQFINWYNWANIMPACFSVGTEKSNWLCHSWKPSTDTSWSLCLVSGPVEKQMPHPNDLHGDDE